MAHNNSDLDVMFYVISADSYSAFDINAGDVLMVLDQAPFVKFAGRSTLVLTSRGYIKYIYMSDNTLATKFGIFGM